MLHHTTNRAMRAYHIAEGEANRAYNATGDATAYFSVLSATYEEALAELEPP